jgi:hypothetical protein
VADTGETLQAPTAPDTLLRDSLAAVWETIHLPMCVIDDQAQVLLSNPAAKSAVHGLGFGLEALDSASHGVTYRGDGMTPMSEHARCVARWPARSCMPRRSWCAMRTARAAG